MCSEVCSLMGYRWCDFKEFFTVIYLPDYLVELIRTFPKHFTGFHFSPPVVYIKSLKIFLRFILKKKMFSKCFGNSYGSSPSHSFDVFSRNSAGISFKVVRSFFLEFFTVFQRFLQGVLWKNFQQFFYNFTKGVSQLTFPGILYGIPKVFSRNCYSRPSVKNLLGTFSMIFFLDC